VDAVKITLFGFARRNLRRKLSRSIIIASCVAVVAGTLFSVAAVMESVRLTLTRSAARLGADLMVVPGGFEKAAAADLLEGTPLTFYMAPDVQARVAQITILKKGAQQRTMAVAKVAPQLFYISSREACCDLPGILLVGLDPARDFSVLPWLDQAAGRRTLADNEVLIGGGLPHRVGYHIQFFDQKFVIAGRLEISGSGFLDRSVFLPLPVLNRLIRANGGITLPDGTKSGEPISAVLVKVVDDLDPRIAARQIEHDIKGVKVVVHEEVQSSVGKQLFALLKGALFTTLILWLIAILMIGIVFSMICNERQREVGMFRAMGAKKRTIFSLMILEAVILSAIGGVAGILAGGFSLFAFKGLVTASLHMPFLWAEPGRLLAITAACLSLAVLTGFAAAALPAVRSSLMEPSRAIGGD